MRRLNYAMNGALLLSALLWTAPSASAQHPKREVLRPVSDSAGEDVEIMRRLLGREIQEALGGTPVRWPHSTGLPRKLTDSQGRYQLTPSLTSGEVVRHSRAFFAEGYGALFSLDVMVPVRPVAPPEEIEEEPAEPRDDGWSQVESEVRGKPAPESSQGWGSGNESALLNSVFSASGGSLELDSEAIESVRKAVRDTVARHGLRIEALGPQEGITDALHLEPETTLPSSLLGVATNLQLDANARWANLAQARNVTPQTAILHFRFDEIEDLAREADRGSSRDAMR